MGPTALSDFILGLRVCRTTPWKSTRRDMTDTSPTGWKTTSDVEMFTDMLCDSYLPFAVTGIDDDLDRFSASVREQPLGHLRIVDGVKSPHIGIRKVRELHATVRNVVGIQYLKSGRELIYQRDDVHILGPGDLMVWDSECVGTYRIAETVHKQTLVLPRAMAASILPRLHVPATVRVARGRQANVIRPVFELLAVLSPALSRMSPQAGARATNLILQMLTDIGGSASAGDRRHGSSDLRDRVLKYIEEHLGDSTLSPATIAAAHYVSIRTLYNAMETLDVPLAGYIRTRRLARCHADLLGTDDYVRDVAARWGFVSHPHFSRAFNKEFGFSPSRVRQQRRRVGTRRQGSLQAQTIQ
jgi:AraC-like DNA-binding protein